MPPGFAPPQTPLRPRGACAASRGPQAGVRPAAAEQTPLGPPLLTALPLSVCLSAPGCLFDRRLCAPQEVCVQGKCLEAPGGPCVPALSKAPGRTQGDSGCAGGARQEKGAPFLCPGVFACPPCPIAPAVLQMGCLGSARWARRRTGPTSRSPPQCSSACRMSCGTSWHKVKGQRRGDRAPGHVCSGTVGRGSVWGPAGPTLGGMGPKAGPAGSQGSLVVPHGPLRAQGCRGRTASPSM